MLLYRLPTRRKFFDNDFLRMEILAVHTLYSPLYFKGNSHRSYHRLFPQIK